MSCTVFLGKLLGLYAILVALSMFAHKQTMVTAATTIFHDPGFLVIYGIIALSVGLAIVIGHNIWSKSALAIVITILGWLSLIKGLLLLFLPPDAFAGYIQMTHYEQLFYLYAAVTLIIGAYLTYTAFRTAPARM